MDIDEAFEILGLQVGADRHQIAEAYRKLSKKHHPDHGDDTNSIQWQLNEANERAVAFRKISDAVTPVSPNSIAQLVRETIAVYNPTAAQQRKLSLQLRKTRWPTIAKWISWFCCGVTAIIALFKSLDAGITYDLYQRSL